MTLQPENLDATSDGQQVTSPGNIEDRDLLLFRFKMKDLENQASHIINVNVLHAILQVLLADVGETGEPYALPVPEQLEI